MVLRILEVLVTNYFPTQLWVHIVVGLFTVAVVHALSQGRKTNRERDLHARVILVTGGFSPTGLTLLQNLAQRGAHIIALTPLSIESPDVSILIDLIRSTTSNEQIYAEQCDLSSPSSIRAFCTKFLTGQETRLDAIIYAHEYQHIGSAAFVSDSQNSNDAEKREVASLATFLMTTLLLPCLLVAPVERDIRIINVVNPFYAAGAGSSSIAPSPSSFKSSEAPRVSLILEEGLRSLRTCVLTRHLQRVFDALPAAQVPKTDDNSSTVPVVSSKSQKSNIVAVSVSPGISRSDTIAQILNADWSQPSYSKLGVSIYFILYPLLRITTKSPTSAIQSILHTLFLPTPFKAIGAKVGPASSSPTQAPEEILKPGALYSNCAAVHLPLSVSKFVRQKQSEQSSSAANEEVLSLEDDGELGGELAGRLVWEGYEEALKAWEKANPGEENSAPDTDGDAPPVKS